MNARSAIVEALLEQLRKDSVPFRKGASQVLADLRRCRQNRIAIHHLLGILPGATESPKPPATGLRALRAGIQDLVYAHAEGIPVLGNSQAVTMLVPDLLDVARHLAVVDLWIEGEGKNG